MKRFLSAGVCLILFGLMSQFPVFAADGSPRPGTRHELPPPELSTARDAGSHALYHLGPEDVLSISVWGEEGLDKEVLIRPDGMLNFPLVDSVQAVGRTIEAVRGDLIRRLKKFIPDPVVSISLLKIGHNRIYVIGEVNKPGVYVSGQYLDVMQALSLAGGFTPYADPDDIVVLRRDKNGQESVIGFDYDKIAEGTHLENNIQLQNGDVIVVP